MSNEAAQLPSPEDEANMHVKERRALMEAYPHIRPTDPHFIGELESRTEFYAGIDLIVDGIFRDSAKAGELTVEAKAMLARAEELKAGVEIVRNRLLRILQDVGEKNVQRPGYSLTVRTGGSGKVRVFDPDLLPREYVRYKLAPPPEPDLRKIGEALKDPARRDEVALAATLDNTADVLMINFK